MKDTPELDRFLRVPEMCALIGVKRGTLYNLMKTGEIKPIKLMSTTVFSEQQTRQWMKSKIKE